MGDRRDFIRAVGAVAVGQVLQPRAPSPQPRAARRLSRIGLQLYTVRDEMEKDFDGTIAKVAATGYSEVEFAGYFKKTPAQVKAVLERNHLAAPSSHIGPLEPDKLPALLDEARAIGHRYVVIPWIPVESRKTLDDWKRVGESFNKAGQQAHDAGLQLAYHNHDFEFAPVEGRIPYDVLLEATDPKLVQLEMDLYWITKGGQDPLSYFARWPGRIPLVHVKDSMGAPDNKMADVGAGKIDWKKIFAREDQAGIQHFFVEHDQPREAFASIRASYDYLKKLEF